MHLSSMVKPSPSPPTKALTNGGIYLFVEDESHWRDDSNVMLKESDDYTQQTTILEEGALMPGGALNLCSGEAMAVFVQYAAIGFLYGLFPGLEYPVFQQYLHLEGYQINSYGALVNIAWSFKIIFGVLSDCFPIFGYRRKPWIVLGWVIALGSCLFMALRPFGAPYCNASGNATIQEMCFDREKLALVPRDKINEAAQEQASVYILASVLATVGYVMVNCVSDAMVVQYAQREPLATRGRIQTSIYVVRTISGILSQLLVGLTLNGPEFGGSFNFSFSINLIYGLTCAPCVLACVATVLWLREEKTEKVPFAKWARQFWTLLQKQVVWQILAFRFLSNIFQNFSSTAISPMTSMWVKVEPLMFSMMQIVGSLLFSSILAVVGKYGLQWNWRWTIALATLGLVAIDSVVYFLAIWDICRNQYFFTGVILADEIPSGVRFIVSLFCAVEIADLGNEGAVYGLVTSVSNLTNPVATALYKFVNSFFRITNADIELDTTAVRWDVTYTFLIAYGMKIGSLGWLFLLPPQKAHLQRLKRYGITSRVAAWVSFVMFFLLLGYSFTTNVLSIFQSTACYRIAGGPGCNKKAATNTTVTGS
ncbi:Aste57867_1391 [Aphanomyces stellatus]|uniref:Aste57867_1391 protein n=1 Tax=Aphanomyces stellatus TaxID=120398 RepID=A0A485KA69_9STRA|nr:hypothetical protein As57867_001390 [Aphanomyces stellatus]VFT78608.1 Aste57867_1391 [Aphanomyces stellatus]